MARGWLEPGAGTPSVMEAMHRWLGQTPSALRAISLADVVGDHRAINQPGTDDEYPNWRLPLTGPDGALVSLEDATRAELAEVLRGTDDDEIQRRMDYRYPPGAVRRLDDTLLRAYGDAYVDLVGNAHRREALAARLEKLRD